MNMRIYLVWAFMMLCSSMSLSVCAMSGYKDKARCGLEDQRLMRHQRRVQGLQNRVSPEEEERQKEEYGQERKQSRAMVTAISPSEVEAIVAKRKQDLEELQKKAKDDPDFQAKKEDVDRFAKLTGLIDFGFDYNILQTIMDLQDKELCLQYADESASEGYSVEDSLQILGPNTLVCNRHIGPQMSLWLCNSRSYTDRPLVENAHYIHHITALSGKRVAAIIRANGQLHMKTFDAKKDEPLHEFRCDDQNRILHIEERSDSKVIMVDGQGLTVLDLETKRRHASLATERLRDEYLCVKSIMELSQGGLAVLFEYRTRSNIHYVEIWKKINENQYEYLKWEPLLENTQCTMSLLNDDRILMSGSNTCQVITTNDASASKPEGNALELNEPLSLGLSAILPNGKIFTQVLVGDRYSPTSLLYLWEPSSADAKVAMNRQLLSLPDIDKVRGCFSLTDGRVIVSVVRSSTGQQTFMLYDSQSDTWLEQCGAELKSCDYIKDFRMIGKHSLVALVVATNKKNQWWGVQLKLFAYDDQNRVPKCIQTVLIPTFHDSGVYTKILDVKGDMIIVGDRQSRFVYTLRHPYPCLRRIENPAPVSEKMLNVDQDDVAQDVVDHRNVAARMRPMLSAQGIKPKPWWSTQKMIGAALAATSVLWRWYGKKTKSSRIG